MNYLIYKMWKENGKVPIQKKWKNVNMFWHSKRMGTYFKDDIKGEIIRVYMKQGKEQLRALGIGK